MSIVTKKHFAIIIPAYDRFGGAERRLLRLASFLIQNGLDLDIYTSKEALRKAIDLGITIPKSNSKIHPIFYHRRRWARRITFPINTIALLIKIILNKYNHVHIDFNPTLTALIYSLFSTLLPPFSLSIVASEIAGGNSESRKIISIIKQIAPCVNAMDCLSQSIADNVISKAGLYEFRSKIKVAPCSFIDYESIYKYRKPYEKKDIDIIYVARDTDGKGFNLLLPILESLVNQLSEQIHIVIIGPKNHYGISSQKIEFIETDNAVPFFGRSKIFLSLQSYDNYPSQALLEAMACSNAIIATNVGDTKYLLDPSCSILIPPCSRRLLESILTLINNNLLCKELGEVARQRVISTQRIEIFAKYFISILSPRIST